MSPATPTTVGGAADGDAAGAIVASRDTVMPTETVADCEMTTPLHTIAGRPAPAEPVVALLAAVAGIVGA
ncbi:hypothetical protein [Halobaculum lipolyticum]|uniref:Uncharacterized protein n=1 Tax=Halobaculum lipolyticum TaxID=3032001 RepID=A0ABD5WCV5_9EURY|nr:hypothetical protein [Halobaculum sp. DT31]